ncbi:MAG: riboflavin synthase [Clostridiales bacterium]|nr:riboflavin synthase [Clostridiales bacterium]
MFTGIVEEVGIVEEIINQEEKSFISIKCSKVLENTKIGDSISTNGVCLTVIKIGKDYFQADVMGETLNRSNIGRLKNGSKVNLERALTLTSRLGGHVVSGHIDGVGEIVDIKKEEISTWITIKASNEILKYIVEKGSISINGVSLTVAYVDEVIFKVSIIPHTSYETNLIMYRVGEQVNLECDILGKYVEKLIRNNKDENKCNITEDFLISNGFM